MNNPIRDGVADPADAPPVTDLLEPQEVEAHFERQQQPIDAVPTPLPTWNRHSHGAGGGVGLAPGWHVTIAGNTGTGKTLLALNIAARAIRAGEMVGFVSAEMAREEIRPRLYSILTGVPVQQLERGQNQYDPEVAAEVKARVAELRAETGGGFVVNEVQISRVERATGLMQALYETWGARVFITDYLQLLAAGDAESLFRQVTDVSEQIRQFAARRKVVSVAVSQFNRKTSREYDEKPRVQGLMASSSIENDSDQVLMLDHSRYERDATRETARTWLILGKNRHGATGPIPVEWDYGDLTIREAKPDEEDRWPGAGG